MRSKAFIAATAVLLLAKGLALAQASGEEPAVSRLAVSEKGTFNTAVLSGGAFNELLVPLQESQIGDNFVSQLTWKPDADWLAKWGCGDREIAPPEKSSPFAKMTVEGMVATRVKIFVPSTRCWWPPRQTAQLRITGEFLNTDGTSKRSATFFNQDVTISVFWFPLTVTILAVVIIYPGSALIAWYLRVLQYRRDKLIKGVKPRTPPKRPGFWASLDPVQITANPYGRGSLSKLQIFVFTLVIFEALLFFQIRNRVLANLSPDILYLLGISAAGATFGKIAYTAKRRISLESWSWLRRRGWLPREGDIQPRAKWSDLFIDYDTKEFDLYSFQMAIFSVVVAVALVSTNITGLEAFEIPPQLLALLGLSQVVFIGGKAIGPSSYQELDQKIAELRQHEEAYWAAKDRSEAEKEKDELRKFKDSVKQAAEMFLAIYGPQIGKTPDAIKDFSKIDPEPL